MISGSCLCGGITYEFRELADQFPLCHCSRCRKFSGSAFLAALTVHGLVFLSGKDLICSYEAPIQVMPPAYRKDFCRACGSPVPWPTGEADVYAVPAGSLDDDPVVRPEGHVWVNCAAPWFKIDDALPQFSDAEYMLHHVQLWEHNGDKRAADGYRYVLSYFPEATEVVEIARARLAILESIPKQ